MNYVKRNSVAMARRGRGLCAGFAAFVLVVLAQSAAAADLGDMLRGSFDNGASASRWEGVYFGAQLGVANMKADFSNASQQHINDMLRQSTVLDQDRPDLWPILSTETTNGRSYGLFLGYNMQWDRLVVGFDVAYNRLSNFETAQGPTVLERIVATTDNMAHDLGIMSQASIKLIDYAAIRARAGYAFGQFLPYAILGAAVGRFNYSVSTSLFDLQTDPNNNQSLYVPAPESTTKNNAIAGGFVAGLGMDVAIMPNVFLRGEWEFTTFMAMQGIRPTLNTGRVGVAVKF
jgi:outer membrane immunogenic protein